MALEIRPAHDPAKDYGFCGVVVDTTNLQGAIFTWWQKDDGTFEAKKTITIDPRSREGGEPAAASAGLRAVPPLVTDIDLSLDDKYLYVACWGLGEMHQYDVSDPMNPKLAGKVEIGGIARGRHPNGKDPSPTARRWSRSAATASASTGPTRSIRHGTTSSIPMTRAARW
jgi:selenium-binding protein 1